MDFTPQTEFEQRPVSFPVDYDPTLNGLGGWLVVVIIGRILTILLGVLGITSESAYLGYSNSIDSLIYLELVIYILVSIIMSCVILYLMFKRNILFRRLFVIQTITIFLSNIILSLYVYNLGYEMSGSELASPLFAGVIWIIYLYKSKRVKNTFIYPKLYN